jgi:Tol biopolymer transport system component
MSLAPGTRLGPYAVVAPVGAGGMGEVYRAHDTRLERTVAIKVLPEHLSESAELRQRFEREAKALSQLSHSHICGVYDVGREGETDFLVMEYLEGELVSERLARGALPLEQVLRCGLEIADALDQAHRHGIVHRDLKPANIMLTRSGVKLLDFGLAKTLAPSLATTSSGAGETSLPTQANLTQRGTILGTVQYMAPEQLEGKEADARTDIFALGAVLFEMATGRKAFEAPSQASLITAIMSSEPPSLASAQPMSPPLLDRLIRACLAKDPEDRVQTAHDAMLQLRWIAEGSQASAPRPVLTRRKHRERVAWAVAAAAVAISAWLGYTRARSVPRHSAQVLHTSLLLPEKVALNSAALSPDGSRVVFSGIDAAGTIQLWLRPLDSESATRLAGTEGGVLPFWSPDGRFIGFFADKKLKRVEATGGAALALYDVDGVGGAWAPGGDILFSPPSGPILRLPASGGTPSPVTVLDTARGETAHRYPFFLPDGRHFLYLALYTAGNAKHPANQIWVGSLDGEAPKPLFSGNFNPQYADGYLLFIRGGDQGGSLLAQRFDPVRFEASGEPITVAEHVGLYGDFLGLGSYSVSTTGTLLYDATRLLTRIEWFDRDGKPVGVFGEPGLYGLPRIAPDGTRIAFDAYDPGTQTTQVWIGDVARGVRTRLTTAPASNSGGVWSPDGTRVAYQSDREHQADAIVQPTGGTGGDEALTDEEGQKIPMDWSPDGRWLVVVDREPAGERRVGITALPLTAGGEPVTVLPRLYELVGGVRSSPDGRWLAYDTNESGRREVYVSSFPEGKQRLQISNAGGVAPKWSRNGREIVYTSFDGNVLSVAVETHDGLQAGTPRPLFRLPEGAGAGWDVSSDGERFLINVPVIKSSSVPLTLVVNWAERLAH